MATGVVPEDLLEVGTACREDDLVPLEDCAVKSKSHGHRGDHGQHNHHSHHHDHGGHYPDHHSHHHDLLTWIV